MKAKLILLFALRTPKIRFLGVGTIKAPNLVYGGLMWTCRKNLFFRLRDWYWYWSFSLKINLTIKILRCGFVIRFRKSKCKNKEQWIYYAKIKGCKAAWTAFESLHLAQLVVHFFPCHPSYRNTTSSYQSISHYSGSEKTKISYQIQKYFITLRQVSVGCKVKQDQTIFVI